LANQGLHAATNATSSPWPFNAPNLGEKIMFEPYKIDRKLPPHELNARRNRKRVVTQLPAIAHLPEGHHHKEHHSSPNDTVYNPATNWVNNQSADENQQ
jgi:hypothetical protein